MKYRIKLFTGGRLDRPNSTWHSVENVFGFVIGSEGILCHYQGQKFVVRLFDDLNEAYMNAEHRRKQYSSVIVEEAP